MTDILGEDNYEPGSVKSILDKGVMFSEKLLVLIDECSSTGDFSEKRNLVNDLKQYQKREFRREFYIEILALQNHLQIFLFYQQSRRINYRR